ncbi:MAG: c-type cytochrome [Candidatus Binatia bacterium]
MPLSAVLAKGPMLMARAERLLLLAMIPVALAGASCEKHDAAQHAAGHGGHAMPKDWKFTLVKGDAAAGRKLFVELECFKCHEVKGQSFPVVSPSDKGIGPELSQMAGSHTIEFFVESIANPNAVIDEDAKKEGHVGADGRSKMPDFADVLTVKQLTDLATYLDSLSGSAHKH